MSFESPTSEEQPFVASILADPDDDGPRLVYADWLAEQGDPRGEFIHVQCRLHGLPMDDPAYAELEIRERALLKKHRAKWIKPLPKLKQVTWGAYTTFRPGRTHFRRGLVEHVSISKPVGFERNDSLFDEWPVRYVTFLEMSDKLAEALPDSPRIPAWRGLELPQHHAQRRSFTAFDPAAFAGLEELAVGENSLGADGLAELLETLRLAPLRALDVHFNEIGAKGVDHLRTWSGLSGLQSLNIGLNGDVGPAIAGLVATPAISGLNELNVWSSGLTGEHARAIAEAESLGRLVRLDLQDNPIGDDGIRAIVDSKTLNALHTMCLYRNQLGDEAAIALATGRNSERFVALDLQNNAIGTAGAVALAESPRLKNLRRLNLAGQKGAGIGRAALRAFAESKHLPHIEFLNLAEADFDDATRAALGKRFGKAFTDDRFKEPS